MYGSSAAPCMPNGLGAFPNSYLASPYGDGLILDLAYIPFSHGAPFPPLPYSTMERAHRHSVHRSICISTAARTISTGRSSAARITRRATIPSSPMRGWRSDHRKDERMLETSGRRPGPSKARPGKRKGRKGVNMSARARPQRVCSAAVSGRRLTLVVLACAALAASGSQAFALIIPVQAILTGGGEVPPNNSPAKGLMTGTFDTNTNTLDMDGHLFRRYDPRIGAHFHGPVSYLGLTPEENAPIQVGTPGDLSRARSTAWPRSALNRPKTSRTAATTSTCTARSSPTANFAAPSCEAPPSLAAPPLLVDEGVRLRHRHRHADAGVVEVVKAEDPKPGKRTFRPSAAANPKACRPSVAMNFRGLRCRKDIDDVIAYIIGDAMLILPEMQ